MLASSCQKRRRKAYLLQQLYSGIHNSQSQLILSLERDQIQENDPKQSEEELHQRC